MNRDDIIRMALEAGFLDREESCHMFGRSRFDEEICVEEYAVGEIVERFAALVAAHERNSAIEQCERLKWKPRKSEYLEGMDAAYDNVIKWLRARGEK